MYNLVYCYIYRTANKENRDEYEKEVTILLLIFNSVE